MKIIISLFVFIAVFFIVYFYKVILSYFKNLKNKYLSSLNQKIKNAYVAVKKEELIRFEIINVMSVLILFFLSRNILVILVGVIYILIFPRIYFDIKQKQYIKEYSKNIPNFIEILISSLKAGLSISGAFKILAQKDKTPIGKEAEDILNKISLGKNFKEALQELSDKIKIKENEILLSALITGIEAGGNISSILENILKTIRKREEIDRELKALTSQGILSGFIVGLLPFFLIIAIYFIDPEFVEPLFTTSTGIILIVISFVMEFLGIFFIRQTIKIE